MTIAPFGSWDSPVTSSEIVKGAIRFYDMEATDSGVYRTEIHPKEGGRTALVRYTEEEGHVDVAKKASVRTRVHEYGGGAFSIEGDTVIYSNDADQELYLLGKGKLTDEDARFADGSIRPGSVDSVWVCERHGEVVENSLVFVGADGAVKTIASGHDFYTSPRFSPDGKQLAFITWDFPYMQWDSSYLWLADINEEGELSNMRQVTGSADESVCQVQWSPDGSLHFVSDKTGFWNLYRWNGEVEALCPMKAEFGVPAWVFGRPTYAFLKNGDIAAMYAEKGISQLGFIRDGELTSYELPFTVIFSVVAYRDKVYFLGGSMELPLSMIAFDPKSGSYEVLKKSAQIDLGKEWVPEGEVLEYPSKDGKVGYGFYYPPKNPNFSAPVGEKPPLIVRCHGGPTGQTYLYLMSEVLYWTSRGYGFVDVNYGGSTGYGREYFKRLEGNWGILDVEDSVSAAKTLVDRGLADEKRLLIRGGSAGGYTVLKALADTDLFAAGTSYYGVSDLVLLCEDTHKFEGKYTDILVGPYPEEIELIKERSPINHVEDFSTPLLLLQGGEDKVVPPNQSFAIYDSLKAKGCPVGMLLFEDEAHGFRKAENIKKSLDAELFFYSQILGIELPHGFETAPVTIE